MRLWMENSGGARNHERDWRNAATKFSHGPAPGFGAQSIAQRSERAQQCFQPCAVIAVVQSLVGAQGHARLAGKLYLAQMLLAALSAKIYPTLSRMVCSVTQYADLPRAKVIDMTPNQRLAFSPIVQRPPLKVPKGVRVIVWVVLALEHWDIARPMARRVIPPPEGGALLPDAPNWSWHEYGMRVGFWRLQRVLQRLAIQPTVTLNARVCHSYPQIVEACVKSGWELNAHSFEQIPMHKLDDERGVIRHTMEVLTSAWGRKPRGWFGPGLTQTDHTIDHLAEAGFEYIGDWALDDEPVTVKTTTRPIVALPYNFELHDLAMMVIQNHASEVWHSRAMDHFETLYEEGAERPKIMSISLHPYLSGVAHRIRYIERTLEAISQRLGVVMWDGERILDWYLAQRPLA
jgi:peptidoglycan/xylan/chitin deacetylase (PgdA/CDA1 family)